MMALVFLLGVSLLAAGSLAAATPRRYRRLQRQHQLLQRRYEKAEAQLHTLWTGKRS